jgi:hypothetical protein
MYENVAPQISQLQMNAEQAIMPHDNSPFIKKLKQRIECYFDDVSPRSG